MNRLWWAVDRVGRAIESLGNVLIDFVASVFEPRKRRR